MKLNTKKIIQILKNEKLFINSNIENDQLIINDITIDSRQVCQLAAFVAIEGLEQDGHDYIDKAIQAGANLIIHAKDISVNANSILVKNSRKAGALIAAEIYGNPSKKLKLIGITGTNGKTTTSTIIFDVLNKLGVKCGIIGTLGYSYGGEMIPLSRTTPDLSDLNRILALMVDQACQVVVMEVSSHSLVLDRVFGQEFDVVGFTNLTQDHLDFHTTFENYYLAKKILFDTAEKQDAIAVINTDDEYGKKYYNNFISKKVAYGLNPQSDVYASNIENNSDFTKFTLNYGNLKEDIESNYIGDFNVYNLLLALTICRQLFPKLIFKKDILKELRRTSGRLEPIDCSAKSKVFIDYAHTPDAIEQVLSTLRKTDHKRLIVVLGCGGDRDKSKRSLMAKIATKLSNLAIFTDDNPRWEDNNQIIADMVLDLEAENYFIIRDRKIAIESALTLGQKDDIVIILGKGHENYQEIKGQKYPFSDANIIKGYSAEDNSDKLAIPYDAINLLDLKLKFEGLSDKSLYDNYPNMIINYISTDSRQIKEESLFIAIKGENFDGNNFIDAIHGSPGKYFTVGEIRHPSKYHLQVTDALQFYGFLAKRFLKLFNIKKVAITGSTGKTTTKEIITSILEQNHSLLKTLGNENNYIGLPRTIFRVKASDDIAVFEIGTNNFGEIGYLSDIIEPDYALITSVDSAHLEKLGSLEGVYKEKTALFRRKLKTFLFPGDNILFSEFKSEEYRNLAYSVGQNNDNSFVYKIVDLGPHSMTLQINNSHYEINNIIPYFALNYAFAISLARLLDININDIVFALKKEIKSNNRMNIITRKDKIIIADCYNANPKSMKAAIDFWANYQPHMPHIAILGDMLELGEKESKLHSEIKNMLKDLTNIKVYTVGKLAKLYEGHAHFASVSDLINSEIIKELSKGVILIKGSHGIHLEKLLEIV